jgi:hypothetical protein
MHDTPGSTAQSVAFTIVLSDSLLHKKIITLILMRIISNINTNGWGASMDACKHLASTKARLLPCDTPARERLAVLLFLLFLILLLSETIHWIGSMILRARF